MPALRLFGRRWHIAADDMPVPAAVLALFHLVWAGLLVAWYIMIHGPSHCVGAWEYDVAVGGLLAAFALSFIIEALIVRDGLQGSIFETKKRRRVPRLMYVNFLSFIAQVAFNAYGTRLIYTEPPQCDLGDGSIWDPVATMKGLVWSTWAVIATLLMLVVATYNLFPDFDDPKSWEQRCRCVGFCCCCCDKADPLQGVPEKGQGQDQQTVMSRLGRLFGLMFGHVDMAPSDIIVSFALAMTLQRMQRSAAQQLQEGAGGAPTLGSKPQQGQQGERERRRKPSRPWPWPNRLLRRQRAAEGVAASAAAAAGGRPQQGWARGRGQPGALSSLHMPLHQHSYVQLSAQSSPGTASLHSPSDSGESNGELPGPGPSRLGRQTPPVLNSHSCSDHPLSTTQSGPAKAGAAAAGSSRNGLGYGHLTADHAPPAAGENLAAVMEGAWEGSAGTPGTDAEGGWEPDERGSNGDLFFRWGSSPEVTGAGPAAGAPAAAAAAAEGRGEEEEEEEEEDGEAAPRSGPSGGGATRAAAGGGGVGGAGGPPAAPSRFVGWSTSEVGRMREDVSHTSSFMPTRPVRNTLAMGATKTSEAEEAPGHPERGMSRKGEHGVVDDKTVQEAAYYCKYAFAAYGWMLSIYRSPGVGWVDLCCGRSCGFLLGMCFPPSQQQRGRPAVPVPDLRLAANLNREAIQQAAGLSNHDLRFVRHEGEKQSVLPYFIGLDTNTQEVILAIRGSLSLDDCVRDLLFEPADLSGWVNNTHDWQHPLPEVALAVSTPDNPQPIAAHSGILEAARATLLDIQDLGVLFSLLLAQGAPCRGWRLVLVGHSLGAACAFLLGLYLRHYFPNLRCWAFSPPGGLASPEVGEGAKDWCTSVVCGKEWIPRLTLATFNNMRNEIVMAAVRCRLPKLQVLWGLLRGKRWTEAELFYPADEDALPDEALETLREYRNSIERRRRAYLETAERFTVPGQVMHLKPMGAQVSGRWRKRKRRLYRAVWIEGSAITEEGVLISGRMMADHMPSYLLATLQRMVKGRMAGQSTVSVGDKEGEEMVQDMRRRSQEAEETGAGGRQPLEGDLEEGGLGAG